MEDEKRQPPDEVRHALLKILYYTLISIRATKDTELTFVLSDHAHNIPHLLDHYSPETFQYYWDIERPCFIRAMERLRYPFASFQEHWTVLKKHYESLPPANDA
jgi:hypothetical protein